MTEKLRRFAGALNGRYAIKNGIKNDSNHFAQATSRIKFTFFFFFLGKEDHRNSRIGEEMNS